MSKHILVTGGLGYIGSLTAIELLNAGYKVSIVDNLSNSDERVPNWIHEVTNKEFNVRYVDCCDFAKLDAAISEFNTEQSIDGVIDFAAFKSVGESVSEPCKYYHNNLVSVINILQIMGDYNIPNLIFSSSCTVYGQPDILPVTESSPMKKAESPYGDTKKIDESIIRGVIENSHTLKACLLRYFNPIGAHPSGLIGELPNGVPQNLLPFITQTAAGIRKELLIFGDDYNTPDGTCIRDYINVIDLAKAHIKAFEYIEGQRGSIVEEFNLGTGKGVSTKEMVDAFIKATGVNVPHRYVSRRPGDIEQIWANPSKAEKILGWKSETSLEDTLKSVWKWQKHLNELNEELEKTNLETV